MSSFPSKLPPNLVPAPDSMISSAQRALPIFKWITGAAGVLALAAAVVSWGLHLETLLVVTAVLVIIAFALVSLRGVANLTREKVSGPALFVMWAVSVLFVATLTVILAATVTDWPWPLKSRISTRISHRLLGATTTVDQWVEAAKAARQSGAAVKNAILPTGLGAARAAFESWWMDTPLTIRKALPAAKAFEALSLNIRIYRDQEIDSKVKPSSLKWADAAIEFFKEINNAQFIVESLMEKAAVYLDLSDLAHVNAESFQKIAASGDEIVKEAAALATKDQQSEVYRIWSRFYYNLARPRSGKLSDNWDNNYLLTAYAKIDTACVRDPNDIKNLTQFARTTQKTAANPPQDTDPKWTEKMWMAQKQLAAGWAKAQSAITASRSRISPLNSLAVLTLEVVVRDLLETPPDQINAKVDRLITELDKVAIPSQREALTLVIGSELEERYDYDLYYDLSRMFAAKILVVEHQARMSTDPDFEELLTNLRRARNGATPQQRDAAIESIDKDECFKRLSPARRLAIRQLWQ